MKLYTAVATLALSGTSSSSAAEEGTPPWDALSSALSSPSILTVPTIDAFVSECPENFLSDPTMTDQTGYPHMLQEGGGIWQAWSLIDQPSKICTSTLTCAFKDCYFPDLLEPGNDAEVMFTDTAGALRQNEGHLAFPARVVQPVSVGDVVAALKWAYENKVPVTVKTSGNNYMGSSTLRGTLNINTRSLPAYAAENIHECAESNSEGLDGSNIIGLSCRLALARGKTGIVRVGGGEVWDAVLQSVVNYNADPVNADGKKYMALSGSAGTVAPAGGWVASGGNAGMRGMRQYGMGVDQVLQMEMVLPDGTHVRFGPSVWEDAPGFLYPKTIEVKGYCNENPAVEEDKWIWKECDVVNFNELWMAARGGGGGTWGIVTSLVYQLHPRPGHYGMRFLPLTTDDAWKTILADETMVGVLDEVVEDFKLEFYFNPSALGVFEDDSNACGNDSTAYPHFTLPPWENSALETQCLGESAAEAWPAAWRTFLMEGRGKDPLLAGGFSEEQIEELSGWAYGSSWREREAAFAETMDGSLVSETMELMLAPSDDPSVFAVTRMQGLPYEGRAASDHPPFVYSLSRHYGTTSTIISTKQVLENRDTLVPFLARMNRKNDAWYLGGKGMQNAHDQMTAIPRSRREGGLYLIYLNLVDYTEMFETMLPIMFGDLDPSSDAFPGFVGHNHNVRHGPLKEDWTKPCPLSYTLDEMDELCISQQEATWGTELLSRLEKFKSEIDPDGIMTCPMGVGFKRAATEEPASPGATDATPPPGPTPEGGDDPTSGGTYFVKPSVFVLGVSIAVVWF